MQELEKILEEIEKLKKMYKESSLSLIDKGNLPCEYDKSDIESAKMQAISEAITIIRKHMAAGWIPVEEWMPEEDGTYLCTLDGELCGIEEPFTGMCGIEDGIWDEPDCVLAWRPLPDPYRPKVTKP